jgi:hypothetical protein
VSVPTNDKRLKHVVWTNGKVEVLRYYTDAQWQLIDKSLADIGVDLEEVTVGGPFCPCEQWWLSPFWPRPLYAALEEMAWCFGRVSQGHRVTPLEKAEQLKSALKTFESARQSLGDFCRTVPNAITETVYPDSTINRAEAALTELIDRGRQHLEKLMAMGPASNKNAKKVHNLYWLELMRLWQAIAPASTKYKHKHLSEFLFACSQPLFPDTKHKTITAFIERHFPQTRV